MVRGLEAGGRPAQGSPTLVFPTCRVDLLTGWVHRPGQAAVRLTQQEAQLLGRLARTPRVAVSREVLLAEVWGYSPSVISRAPDVAVRRLRMKIEVDAAAPRYVLTERGEGWRVCGLVEADLPVADGGDWLVALARAHAPEQLATLVSTLDEAIGDQLPPDARQALLAHAGGRWRGH